MNLKQIIREEINNVLNEGAIDILTAEKIHKFLTKKFREMARADGMRMSHFESEYPTVSSFFSDLQKHIK